MAVGAGYIHRHSRMGHHRSMIPKGGIWPIEITYLALSLAEAQGRVMLKLLLVYRTGIGQVLGIMACTATIICFEHFFEWRWFAAVPVGALAYITMPILLANFIEFLELR
jgi:hypothetical protein